MNLVALDRLEVPTHRVSVGDASAEQVARAVVCHFDKFL